MAEALIVHAIQAAVSSALPIIQEQIMLVWCFEDDLKELRDSLDLTGAFLRDAETKQLNDPLKVWLKQLRDVVCKADDVLDKLAYEDVRRKVEPQMAEKVSNFCCQLTELIPCLKKVSNFFCPSETSMVFTLIMAYKVKNIKLSMKKINDRASQHGLHPIYANAAPVYSEVPVNHAFVTSADLKGRKDDVQKIVGLLTPGSTAQQTLSIVSIVGMAGLGKTALAKSVCKTEKVKNYYSNKMIEVCVSQNFDVFRILKEMFESLISRCGLQNEGAIIKKIQEEVKGKPYLLMLDDVWDEDPCNWNALRARLLEINEGNQSRCMILVTTRNKNIAIVKETLHENRHDLENLKPDECWSIIEERALKNSSMSPPIYSKLEDIGREIARKCGGVPLIATIIGGTMCNNLNIDEWEKIRDDPLWAFLEKTNDGAVRVLRLSFDRLSSPSLKQCFAYCSIFPKGFNIQKEQLIQLWMAEGFLQQSGGSSQEAFEDIGSKYFDNLLSNFLLQDEERDKYGCITTCKMHDIVHDLAQSISNPKILNAEPRSLFVTVERFQSSSSFKGLRVLKFIGASLVSLPDSISNLKFLRYFDISETDIGEVTESINKLYLLQTLRLLDCNKLEKLPQGMKNLVSLRHLCFNNERLVLNGIDGLTNLQTLPMFNVCGEGGCGIGELGNLSELGGELTIFNLQNVRNKDEAGEAKLMQKKNLRKLNFEWHWDRILEDCSNEEEVLEGLEPHSNLKSLTINCYAGVRIPSWLERKSDVSGQSSCFQLKKLEELMFLHCRYLKNLPTLGLYPNLKFLEIISLDKVSRIGKKFYIDDNGYDGDKLFPVLETFSLNFMQELEEWLIEEEPTITVFPSLKELRIRWCYKLSRIPMMSRFSSLEMLQIKWCNELCWTRELEEGDGVFPSTLKFLTIWRCKKLRYIPGVKGGISSLQELTVYDCEGLSRIGETLLASTCLRKVWIKKCSNLESIPLNGLSKSTRLETLRIGGCPNLTSIPSLDGISFLSTLEVYGCQGLTSLPSGLQTCTSLQRLSISKCSNVKALPEWLGNLSSLRELYIEDCKNLEQLPSKEAMQRLSNRVEIYVFGCPRLKEYTDEFWASKIFYDDS